MYIGRPVLKHDVTMEHWFIILSKTTVLDRNCSHSRSALNIAICVSNSYFNILLHVSLIGNAKFAQIIWYCCYCFQTEKLEAHVDITLLVKIHTPNVTILQMPCQCVGVTLGIKTTLMVDAVKIRVYVYECIVFN